MSDSLFMQRCLTLAQKGLGYTYPNPMVGCVVVHEGKIIAEGWHKKAGKDHAEREAILSVKNQHILSNSTLYVNLEPCDHQGKTPPCSDLIVQMKIPRVVIGCLDQNQKVFGKGLKKLQAAGCAVKTGVLETQCIELNRRFFSFHQKKTPLCYPQMGRKCRRIHRSKKHQHKILVNRCALQTTRSSMEKPRTSYYDWPTYRTD